MKKAGLFELVFGVLLILVGVIRPGFVWRLDALDFIRRPLGNTGMAIALIVLGAALIVWALFKMITTPKTAA